MTYQWRVFRDGRPLHVRLESESDAFGFLLRHQGQSVDHATKHEGYEIRRVPAERWSDDEARELVRTARRLFGDHGHPGYWDDETRASCGACALAGYGEHDEGEHGHLAPNYAAWARDYVQAGRGIPARYARAFAAELLEDTPYGVALRLDVSTFGARIAAVTP